MFENSASFPGISRGSNLLVSNILQKAGIEVNEEGSVAYAASGKLSCRDFIRQCRNQCFCRNSIRE